ncbi:sperm-tail PG-rich repeat-containing protein 2 isoform X2 [Mastomys coucha]|uniref:sperm-tail PG-rich repeat-containing protein 2 isoform X2 n=1 Tax=Mastomys coucha TaxID=35658 RepID=UPI0012623038|nr:sperm-tail PG-rich repeat-containing protein 2 isoform X2 [Mastomys coucha]
MYDRAPRTLDLANRGGTEEHVGPGSYQVPFPKPRAPDCHAPFLSLSSKTSAFVTSSDSAEAVPGPAHYNVSEAQDYSKAALKYRGINFGNTTGRQELLKYSGPGPGQYDIIQKNKLHYENINIKRDEEYCCSYVPRLYEALVLQEEKRGVPGPGKYNIKSEFDTIKSMSTLTHHSSFIFYSETERFEPIKSCAPAPGTYNEIRTAFKYQKKRSGVSSPFGQNAARFTKDSKAQDLPGPGFYDISKNIVKPQVKKPSLKKKPKTGFGSSVPRTMFPDQKKAFSGPGPTAYQVVGRMQDELPNLTNQYAAFLSKTERMQTVRKMRLPGPGCYDVQKSYDMSQVKHNYMPPRSSVAKSRHSSFLSAAPRCVRKIADGPGPATYSPILMKSGAIVTFVKGPKRFEEFHGKLSPGPTTYELSPFLRHSLLKRTYNVTLPCSSSPNREHTGCPSQKNTQKFQKEK